MPYFPTKISIAQYEVLGNWDLAEDVLRDPKNLHEFFLHKKITEAAPLHVKVVGVPKQILLGQRKNHVSRHPEVETYHMILNLKLEKTSILSIKFSHRLTEREREALCDVADALIKDKRTFIFYPQQSSWIFMLNPSWTKGVDGAMGELFPLNPDKGSTTLRYKAFRRLSSICLSPTGFITGLEGFRGIYVTKADVLKFYDGDEEKTKRFIAATDGFNPISTRMMTAMVGRRLFRPFLGGKTWRMLINRFLPRPLDGWSGQLVRGEVKGNVKVLAQLDGVCDYVVYEWNCTTEFHPHKLIEMARFSTIIHSVRTRWCWQSVMNMGAWGLYALSVRRRGEAVKDVIANGAESIRNEFKIICEAYNEDVLDDLEDSYVPDEDEDEDSYGDVVSIFKKMEDPMEFADIRSKVVNMLFNGPAYKYKAQTFSIAIPDNWAKLAYCCPDLTGFNEFGLIDFDKCQLKAGQVYYAGKTGPSVAMRRPNASANEILGIRGDQPFNLVSCDYYAEDTTTLYFNVFDIPVWMPQAGGADFDDAFVVFFNELVVKRLKKNAWFPPKSTLPESFKDGFMEVPPCDSDKPHSWKRFGLEVLESYRNNNLPGIGLYAYCLGCLHMLMRYGPQMLQKGMSYRRRALPWSDEVIRQHPRHEDRWEYFDIDSDWKYLGVDPIAGKKIFKNTREIITEVLKKRDVFLWALEHIEAVIDAANGKPKYVPNPDVPGTYMPMLSAYRLVSYMSSMFKRYPGPNGRYLKNWIRIHTVMDDAISGVGGCEYKTSEGKKNDVLFFGAWDNGRVIPAVLNREGGFTSKKQEALKKTGLIFFSHTKAGHNQTFIRGEFTDLMKEVAAKNQWDSFFEAYWDLVYNNAEFRRWEDSEPWHYGYVGEHGTNWLYNMLSGDRTKSMEPESKLEEYIRQSMVEGAYHIEKRMKQYALLKLFRTRTDRRAIEVHPEPEMRKKVHRVLVSWFVSNSKDTILRKKNDDKFKPKETFNEYDELVKALPSHNIMDVYSPSERIGWMGNLVWHDEGGNRQTIEITKHFIAWLIKKERQSME